MKEIIKTYPRQPGPIRVEMAGISYCDGSYHITRERAEVTVLEYVVRGEGTLLLAGHPVTASAGQVYLLPRGEPHDYRSSATDPWEKIFINLRGELPLLLLEQLGLRGRYVFDGAGLYPLFRKVAAIARCTGYYPGEDSRLEAVYYEVLSRLAHTHAGQTHSPEAERLKMYLDTHPHRPVGNRELAGVIYRSPDYCIKLFRQEYGTTPYDYQLEERLRIARQLLRDTGLPVSEIAARVGYRDPAYFSGLFRKKCGVSPREYRCKG